MSVQVKRRRESASFLSTFTGAQGELLVDTTTWRVQVHDGSTPGGHPMAKQSDTMIGIGTAANATNPLSVKSNSSLFDNKTAGDGGDGNHRIYLNKEASGNTGSHLFETNYSARAEFGLLGSDSFEAKVSPNGSAWYQSLKARENLHGRTDLRQSWRRQAHFWLPRPVGAIIDTIGCGKTDTGTIGVSTQSSTNFFTQSGRVKFTSSASAGSSCGALTAQQFLWRGNAANLGGFFVVMRGGIETFQTDCRMFMGLHASTSAITNVNPSTLTNIVGIGFDSGQSTLRLLTNDDTGSATATDLGSGFPTTGAQDLYELILSAEPNASEIRYRVERLNSGDVAEGAITSDLPQNSVFLATHFWLNNGTTAAAVEMAVVSMYAENASLNGSRNGF